VRAPDEAGTGSVQATVSLDAWKDGQVGPSEIAVTVTAANPRSRKPASPQLLAKLALDSETVWGLAFRPDGKTLAASELPGTAVRRWRVADGRQEAAIQTEGGDMYGLAFSPNGQTVITPHFRSRHRRFKENGRVVSAVDYEGCIRFWDASNGELKTTLRHTPGRAVARIAVSPDGAKVAAAEAWSEKGGRLRRDQVSLWDVALGKVCTHLPVAAGTLGFGPDGRTLATVGDKVQLWDATTGRELATLPRPKEESLTVNCLAFAPDGRTLAGADYKANLFLWNVPTRTLKLVLKYGEGRHRITGLAFAPNGRTLVGTVDGPGWTQPAIEDQSQPQVVFWDTVTGKQRAQLTAPPGSLLSIALSPDGKKLATGGIGCVLLWDVAHEMGSELPSDTLRGEHAPLD
jgi:WD40 repeat protein